MSKQWKLLIACIHGALGQFLSQVDLDDTGPTPQPTPAKVTTPPQPAAEKVAAAPEVAPTPAPEESDPADEVPVPTLEDISDANFSRKMLENFMLTRGFSQEDLSKMLRPALNKAARAQVVAIQAAGAGVRRRGPAAKKTEAGTKPRTAMDELLALTPEQRAAIAAMLNVNPEAPDMVTQAAALLSTPEAVLQMVAVAVQEADDPEVSPVATVTVEAATPPPLASTPPSSSRRPAPVAAEPEPESPPAELADGPAKRLLNYVNTNFGEGGVLQKAPTNAQVIEFIPKLQKVISDGLKSDDPKRLDRYTKYTTIMKCGGKCIDCPFGGAQQAVCLATFDKDYAKDTLELVLKGEMLVKFKKVEGDIWDENFQNSPAELEVAR